jgi:putative transposase
VRFTTCIISRGSLNARNAYGTDAPRITPHAAYLWLGADKVTRLHAYRRLFASMDAHDIDALRLHTQQQKPWGSERFRQQIEALAQRSVELRPRGRPRSNAGE